MRGFTNEQVAAHNLRVARGKAKNRRGDNHPAGQPPELEPDSGDESLGAMEVQETAAAVLPGRVIEAWGLFGAACALQEWLGAQGGSAQKFHIKIEDYRLILVDYENLCSKYATDWLRFAGFIPDDRPEDITLEVRQIKVDDKSKTGLKITITEL